MASDADKIAFSHLFVALPELTVDKAVLKYLKKKGLIDDEAVAVMTSIGTNAALVKKLIQQTKGMSAIERIIAIAPEALSATTIDFLRSFEIITPTQAHVLRLAIRAGGTIAIGGPIKDRADIIMRARKLLGVGLSEEAIALLRSMELISVAEANAARSVLLGGNWTLETVQKLKKAKTLVDMLAISGKQLIDPKVIRALKLTGLINVKTANAVLEAVSYGSSLWTVFQGAQAADGLAARMAYVVSGSFSHEALAFAQAAELVTPDQVKLLRIAVQLSQAYNRVLMEQMTNRRYRVYAGERPIVTFARASKQTESQLLRLLAEAAQDARKRAKAMHGLEGKEFNLRAKALHEAMREVWEGTGYLAIAGEREVAAAALESTEAISSAYKVRGYSGEFLSQMLQYQARAGIDSYISRQENTQQLARRVYGNYNLFTNKIDKLINKQLLIGSSADQLAKEVGKFISPTTPGGVSYAAQRLARTEIANAFHQTTIRHTREMPWVSGYKWNLSSSHGKPDVCNDYANDVHFNKGEAGVFKKADVPAKPHPQCLCYLTVVEPDEEAFIAAWKKGRYDRYLNTFVDNEDVQVTYAQRLANQTIKLAATAGAQVALTKAYSLGAKMLTDEGFGNWSFNPTVDKWKGLGAAHKAKLSGLITKLKSQGVKFKKVGAVEVPEDFGELFDENVLGKETDLLEQREQLYNLITARRLNRAVDIMNDPNHSYSLVLRGRAGLATATPGSIKVGDIAPRVRLDILKKMEEVEYGDILPERDQLLEAYQAQLSKGMYGTTAYRVMNGRLRLANGDLIRYNNSFDTPDFIGQLSDIDPRDNDYADQLNKLYASLVGEPLDHPTLTPESFSNYASQLLQTHLPTNVHLANLPESGWTFHSDVIRALDKTMEPIPRPMISYRATGHDFFGLGRDITPEDVGTIFKDHGFTSTEGIKNYYNNAGPIGGLNLSGRNVKIQILSPAGTLMTRINDFEHELLLSRGTSFQVTDVRTVGGQTFADVVVLAQDQIETSVGSVDNTTDALWRKLLEELT
jgi:hypothetical protein